jgi:hypothetical protein
LESDGAQVACTTTTADGSYAIDIPNAGDFVVHTQKAGYRDQYIAFQASGTDDVILGSAGDPWRLLDLQTAQGAAKLCGGVSDDTTGSVVVAVGDQYPNATKDIAGASFAISGATAIGPCYNGANGVPDRTLTATSTAGLGSFLNIAPGDVTVSISHATLQCSRSVGWHTNETTSVKAHVVAGGMAVVVFVCTP